MNRIFRARRSRLYPIATIAIVLAALSAGTASAGANAEIERVWSFNGGEVAISSLSGKLVGIVVTPTKFAECAHKAGEEMWTGLTLQPERVLLGPAPVALPGIVRSQSGGTGPDGVAGAAEAGRIHEICWSASANRAGPSRRSNPTAPPPTGRSVVWNQPRRRLSRSSLTAARGRAKPSRSASARPSSCPAPHSASSVAR